MELSQTLRHGTRKALSGRQFQSPKNIPRQICFSISQNGPRNFFFFATNLFEKIFS